MKNISSYVAWVFNPCSLILLFTSLSNAVTPTESEISQAHTFASEHWVGTSPPVFSFHLANADPILANWKRQVGSLRQGPLIHHHAVWTDPKTKLTVRCTAVEYTDFPVVEWTIYLKNDSDSDSPLLSDIHAIDLPLPTPTSDVILHHNTGSPCLPIDYQPFADPLPPGTSKHISTAGGRSTNSDLPFFNLQSNNAGTIIALGWPGQWAADFTRDNQSIRVVAGQELTHLILHPGEQIRTPLVAMLFYQGDPDRGQNLWRSWMIAHNLPRTADGKTPQPMTLACSSHQFGEMIHADEASQKLFIDRYLEEKIKLDYWWMDAGWYVNNGTWPNTGTWEVDPKRFPNGLRAITDHAHSKGVKSIVWFEPERVTSPSWIYNNHPEWLLPGSAASAALSPPNKLLNLGNDDARTWWTNHADDLITKQGIDLYRTDFNIDPLPYWRSADAPDRQGITENRYVTGLLSYLDELRHRHPNLLIDTCASGGRRNDLEMLRRAVPLLRSDYILEPIGQQNHTFGISPWIPFYGTGVNSSDPYLYRSQISPSETMCYDVRRHDLDYASIRTLWSQHRQIADCLLGDFYPLTPYDPSPATWMAWQFDLPSQSRGVIQAFRRPNATATTLRLHLKGLDPAATYDVQDVDHPNTSQTLSGQSLLTEGLLLNCPSTPAAVLFTYQKHTP